ncbi:MAG: molybdopterin-guanine dinucleotide biosynthesis protein MobB [Gemmatimonadales bacterium]|nr:molybdopterin-guanine dinucleotide biosynthesis protein MobB [Gemmatimonadales bacterium]MBP9199494.1 molybdopterin-guanine dinucleotide biosynthesis protein MobB [Gemmatimonadales bacterium]
MAGTRILSVIGRPGAGKSTLIAALVSEFGRKGRRVAHVTPDRVSQNPIGDALSAGLGADLILVEGVEQARLPKIEVHRLEAAQQPLYTATDPHAAEWVAIVTDDDKLHAPCPVLRFRDTMWLQLLANLAWEKALVP